MIGKVKRSLMGIVVLAGVLTATAPIMAGGVVYRWVDKKGVIHLTDDLSQVPEPYASMYQAEIRESEKNRTEHGVDRVEPPARATSSPRQAQRRVRAVGIAERRARQHKEWQKRVATWRGELSSATQALARVERELSRLTLNPLLRTTPPVKSEIKATREEKAKALERVEKARTMLLEKLPAEAKKDGVPRRWLQ